MTSSLILLLKGEGNKLKINFMEISAQTKSIRISPRKVRLVVDSVRNMSVNDALSALRIINKRAAGTIEKTLRSAVANAVNNAKLNALDLTIARIEVTDGQALKRFHPSTRGRVHPYKKRGSNIRIVLNAMEKKGEVAK